MNREKKLVKNTFILSIGSVLPKFASIITLPIITACLTKAEYGTYDLIIILVSLFLPIATLQMQTAGFRFLINARNDEQAKKSIITNIIFFTIPVSITALVILYVCLYTIDPVIRILIVTYFFIDTVLKTVQQMARGLSRNFIYSLSAIISSSIELLLILLFLSVLNGRLSGLLTATIVAEGCSLIFIIWKSRLFSYFDLKSISKSEIVSLLKYSWPMIPDGLSSWIMRVSDRLIITAFLGVEANAIYAVANKLPNMFSIMQNTFALAWQESASLALEDADSNKYYSKIFDNIFNLLIGIMALLIASTPILFVVLIQGDYGKAYYQMPILYIGILFSSLSSYLGGIYVANMQSKKVGISTATAALCSILINLVFVKIIGIYAASIATLVSYFLLTVYRMKDVTKFQPMFFNVRKITFSIALLSLMSLICYQQKLILNIINAVIAIVIAVVLNKKLILRTLTVMKQKIRKK